MFLNPIFLAGVVVFVSGWFWLLGGSQFGVGVGTDFINIHGKLLAMATIMSGVGLSLAGLIIGGFEGLRDPALARDAGFDDLDPEEVGQNSVPIAIRHAMMDRSNES
ncbi:hypothetical protein [Hoeflea halophila]|uniref:hypothetical protein n=1 Tax=Hoeflea halophila TaxID=714899 RepID=UPI001FCF1D13|nr:hypothetical protein [Hoeflea halophila]